MQNRDGSYNAKNFEQSDAQKREDIPFAQMPYERPDGDALAAALEDLTRRLEQTQSPAEQLELYREQEALIQRAETMMSLCHVRNTIDTRDPYYEKERAFCDELAPVLEEKQQAFLRAFAASPCREQLEQKLGKLLFTDIDLALRGFSPQIVPLVQEENALAAQYQKLYASARIPFGGQVCNVAQLTPFKQDPDRAVRRAALEAEGAFFDDNRADFDKLFTQLVANRTQQARQLGFSNFVQLGYVRRGRNCYGPDEVAAFRNEVVNRLVPLTVEHKRDQARRIGITDFSNFKFCDNAFAFPDGNPIPEGSPEDLLAAARRMYNELSPETAAFIEMMFNRQLFDLVSRDGKAPGGYCTEFATYGCPFIFSNFNGTSGDVDVLTHEAGHAFASFISAREIDIAALRQPTMEGCETHSMSMEFLTEPWHELFFGRQTDKYELSHAQDALYFIPYGCMVDEFQHIAYERPEMTPEERNAAWLELEQRYRPYIDFDGLPFYGRGAGWQRQLHIYLYPFYYIDYCLAQTMALQFWAQARRNRQHAWENYLAFVKRGGTQTFLGLVHSAGLVSPFAPGGLQDTVAGVEQALTEYTKRINTNK